MDAVGAARRTPARAPFTVQQADRLPQVTLVSDIQGAEFPVFAHLADSGLASRIDTVSFYVCSKNIAQQSLSAALPGQDAKLARHTDNRGYVCCCLA